jgi:uncharacterized protein (AIM24 family)
VQGGLLLDVVVGKSSAILQLLTSENKTLLVRWDAFLVLNLSLDVLDGVRGLYFKCDGLAGQGLDEDLHTTTETEHQVQGGLLLDVVVGKSSAILQLLTSENKTLLVRWDAFLVLNLSLDVLDGVRGLYFKCDGLAGQGLDEDLHTTTETEHQMQGGLLLDVVVGKSSAILQLLTSENKTLLVRWDAFLVLNLSLDVLNGVRGLYFKCDGLAGQGLDEDLHTTTETEHQMQGGLLLDVVVGKSSAILQLLTSENKTLLVRWDAFLVLNLSLDVLDGVRGLYFKCDGLAGQGLDEDLHTTTETEHQMQGGLLLDVVVGKSSAILQLLTSENKTLLVRWDAFLVLNLSLDVLNGVRGLYFKCDGLAGQGLDEDLHTTTETEHQMQGGLLLDVVVGKSSAILQLLTSENKTLLVRWDAFLVLNLSLDVLDGVRGLYFKCDGLAGQGLDEDLHTTTETEHQMQGGLLLDVVVGKSSAILQLLTSENKTLLVRWDAFLVLNLSLDVLNGVRGLYFKCDGFTCKGEGWVILDFFSENVDLVCHETSLIGHV